MQFPKRKPNRLRHYDYSQKGAYFITVCTKDKKKLFWQEQTNVGVRIARPLPACPQLSSYGKVVDAAIRCIETVYPAVRVDHYVVMPNHIHLLLYIDPDDSGRAMRAPTISTVINQLKGYVSKSIGFSCWQKLFYDHVIRDRRDYEIIWNYIDTNPQRWEKDCFYCE